MMTRVHAPLTLLACAILGGCASAPAAPPAGQPAPEPVTYELLQPAFDAVAPSNVALGDTVKVYGKNFIDPDHGELRLHLEGTFTDHAGNASRWIGDVPLQYVAPNQASFVFGPGVFFSPSGFDIGTFAGGFQIAETLTTAAINAEPGDPINSVAVQAQLEALPSIYVSQLRAVGAPGGECDLVTRATTAGQNFALGLQLIGAADATKADPITYSITYDASDLVVAYAANTTYDRWPFWGPSTPTANATVASGQSTFSVMIDSGTSLTIDPQHYEQVAQVSPAVTFNQQLADTVKLAGFATPTVDGASSHASTIYVRATRNDGTTFTRTLTVPVWSQIELPATAPSKVPKQWLAPELVDFVTGSIPSGTDENYHQSTQDSKTQQINMTWNVMNQEQLGFSLSDALKVGFGLPAVAAADNTVTINASTQSTWSQTFGTDVSKSVTATIDQGSSVTQHVQPGMNGAIYLQWLGLEAAVDVTYHTPCGKSGSIGQAVLSTWKGGYLLETSVNENPAPAKDAAPVGPIQ